jgi:hypothetical protein
MVLSAILAQSLMIVNLPCERRANVRAECEGSRVTHDHAVFPDVHMIANGRCFYDGIGTNVDKVPDLHRVIVECTAICLVRRPETSHDASDGLGDATTASRGETHLMTHPSPTRQ